MLKKFFKAVLCNMLAAIMAFSLAAIPASAASLNYSSFSITKGYSTTLRVSGTSSKVAWSSSDKTIATVSSAGKVVGKAAGTCYIYAKTGSTKLSCRVKVLYGKLTTTDTSVSLESGDSEFVTITAKGSHALKVSSSDKSVATATWAGSFSENEIDLKITAKKSGTTTVKVYFKNYTSIYKYINVTVEGGEVTTTTPAANGIVSSTVSNVSLAASESSSFNVYSTVANKLTYSLSDPSVATVTFGTWTGNYLPITVKGTKAGTTSLKIYRTDNAAIATTVPITVTGSVYYTVSETSPVKSLSTDSVISYAYGSYTRYMLVPTGYDIAYTNSLFASNLNSYNYYTVYSSTPSKIAAADVIKTFSATVGYNQTTRYILVPGTSDEAKYNTAVSSYTNSYSYYTIYNSNPTKAYVSDVIMSWTIVDPTTKATIARYMLLPVNYDTAKYDQLVNADKNANPSSQYYIAYAASPTKLASTDVITYLTDTAGKTMYMLTPANCDIIKRNDAIRKTTGTVTYYAIYSTVPATKVATDTVQTYNKYGYGTVYMLQPATPEQAKIDSGMNGNIY